MPDTTIQEIAARVAFDPKAFIDGLAAISRPDGKTADEHANPPIGRLCLAFTPLEAAAREFIRKQMLASVRNLPRGSWSYHEDAIGNAIFEIPGTDATKEAIVVLSHIDSVLNGGKYDGPLGIAAGLCIVDQIAETGRLPRRTLKIIACVAEESGITGTSCVGARYLMRLGTAKDLAEIRYDKTTLGKHLGPMRMATIARDWHKPEITPENTAAAFELHVEQSHLIAQGGYDMAVVCDGIGGAWRQNLRVPLVRHRLETPAGSYAKCTLRFLGKPAHTGAMPPNPQPRGGKVMYRKDALIAACYTSLALLRMNTSLLGMKPLATSGFTTVPYDQEVHLLVPAEEVRHLRRALDERASQVATDFGVVMTHAIEPHVETSVSVCELRSAERTLHIPIIAQTFSQEAFRAEQTELGLTRMTITDLTVAEEGTAKLDGRDVSTEAGTRLRVRMETYLLGEGVDVETISITPYAAIDEELSAELMRFAEQTMIKDGGIMRALKVRRMPSFPGHDLREFLKKGIPGALVFVRQNNADETSHSPRETMEWEHFFWALGPFVRFVLHKLNT